MKTSLKKLQKFAALRQDKRAEKHHQSLDYDELGRATQDMLDMRDCYDKLLSAAAATANSVYEFSESLREMGDCLLEKTSLNDDEESGRVLLMMGKVQIELQKLVDSYRSHIFQTVTVPSESLLNELHIVEEMKKRCDEKREIYDDLVKKQKEKGKLKSSKGECFPSHHLQAAREEFDEEVNVFVFRMKSLKQGQSRSLLTQASRHHAAQLCFFKKAVICLEAIDPHVRLLAEERHIDYQFSELKEDLGETDDDDDDDESDGDDDSEDGSESQDDGELSFDYRQSGPLQEASTLKISMELDDAGAKYSPDAKLGSVKEKLRSPARNSFSFQRDVRKISISEPLFPEKRLDSLPQMRALPSSKFMAYALPTPDETKNPSPTRKLENKVPQTREAALNLWHSSPLLDKNKYEKLTANEKFSGPIILDTQSVLKESNTNSNTKTNTKASRPPPPLSQALSFKRIDSRVPSYAKKAKRQAFSGPLTGKPLPNNPSLSASGPISSSGLFPPTRNSGALLRASLPRPASSPKLSSSQGSSIFMSTPKISELHELPRPPAHLAAAGRSSNRSTHSGPLISKRDESLPSRASTSSSRAVASTLPMPPHVLPRSFSIPAGGPKEVAALREDSQHRKTVEDIFSPPLTPMISLSNVLPASPPS